MINHFEDYIGFIFHFFVGRISFISYLYAFSFWFYLTYYLILTSFPDMQLEIGNGAEQVTSKVKHINWASFLYELLNCLSSWFISDFVHILTWFCHHKTWLYFLWISLRFEPQNFFFLDFSEANLFCFT